MYTQKSFVLKPADAEKKWWLIDAQDKVVGRLATEIADVLRGKRNPKYTPHTDSGDFVVVVNADKVQFTGNKWEGKKYYWHTNHIGGLKQRTAQEQLDRKPEQILMSAVKGMLPKTSLGRQQLTKLKLFAGEAHSHEAQKPEVYKF
ncbi:MAG: 50S ribosomal protein L13 [Bacteriovoracaceae bacterium]|nr:50S ribosomal protein L13 [Bacteriovoracaceae bacterium]